MTDNFPEIASLLSCPDDGAPLYHSSREFHCSVCARRFPLHEENVAEILPRHPYELPNSVSAEYQKSYLRAFEQDYRYSGTSMAWGAEETAAESWVRKRRRQVEIVRPLITEGLEPKESVLCDFAAGAGYYTLSYARLFRLVIHCDLSVDNLNYAWRNARSHGIHNILFLRMDYFAPPFRQSLDRIFCLDTLIRGEAHDSVLVAAIARSLKPSGCAVVDFHNWWHNPLRRLGLLPENFGSNRSYRRTEVEQLLRKAGIERFVFHPFIQEFDANSAAGRRLSGFFPPTRLIYCIASPHLGSSLFEASRVAGADGD
jgi:SAM-dependent methyltransferase